MNFAFSAVIIIWILLPGAVFISVLFRDPRGKYFYRTPLDFVVQSIFPSLFSHLVAYKFVEFLLRVKVDFECLLRLLTNSNESNDMAELAGVVEYSFLDIMGYSLLVCAIAGLFGSFIRSLIFRFRLDLSLRLFRIQNEWFYILYGRSPLSISGFPDFISVSVVLKNEPQLSYVGILEDYSYSKDKLKYMLLKYIQVRKNLDGCIKPDSKDCSINGTMYFDYENILSINFNGFQLGFDKDGNVTPIPLV